MKIPIDNIATGIYNTKKTPYPKNTGMKKKLS